MIARGLAGIESLKRHPPAACAVAGRANVERINRMNFPKRNSPGIRADGVPVAARYMAPIEELLAGHAYAKSAIGDIVHVARCPFRRTMMRDHLRYESAAFLRVRSGRA